MTTFSLVLPHLPNLKAAPPDIILDWIRCINDDADLWRARPLYTDITSSAAVCRLRFLQSHLTLTVPERWHIYMKL